VFSQDRVMPNRTSKTGSELFIVDNSDADWKVLRFLHDWCQISQAIDIATGYFEIGALLGLKDEWQKVDHIRILMGDEVTLWTKAAFVQGLSEVRDRLDASLEAEKLKNDFLVGIPAKAYITYVRLELVGASGLVGSSNFTCPGLTENIELNVQITGRPMNVLQEWYEEHWNAGEDVLPDILERKMFLILFLTLFLTCADAQGFWEDEKRNNGENAELCWFSAGVRGSLASKTGKSATGYCPRATAPKGFMGSRSALPEARPETAGKAGLGVPPSACGGVL